MRVVPFSPGSPNLRVGRQVYLAGLDAPTRIRRSRPDRGAFIIAVNAINDRDAAQLLSGTLIEAADKDVVRDDPDSYFVHELIGLNVVTDEGEPLGVLSDVLQMGAADVYVVNGPRGEILLPAIADVVREIDLNARLIRITLLPGLLDESK